MSIDFQRRFDRILYQIFGKSFRNQSKSLTSSLEIIEIPQKPSSQQYLQDLVSGYGLAWLLWIWVQTSAWICHVSWDPSLDISEHIFTVSVGHCIWIQSRLDTVNIGSDLSVTMFRDGSQDIPGHMVEPSWSLSPYSQYPGESVSAAGSCGYFEYGLLPQLGSIICPVMSWVPSLIIAKLGSQLIFTLSRYHATGSCTEACFHMSCDVLGSIPDHSQAEVASYIHITEGICIMLRNPKF